MSPEVRAFAGRLAEDMAKSRVEASHGSRFGSGLTFEQLVTDPDLGAFSPSPTQLALIRSVDGRPLENVLTPEQLAFHFGVDASRAAHGSTTWDAPTRPRTVVLRTGVRAGKSFLAAMALLYSVLRCQFRREPMSHERPAADGKVGVRPGELVRALIVAPLLKQSRAVFQHLVSTMQRSPALSKLLVKAGAEQAVIRRPDGNEVLVELVAASSAGGNLRSTWLAGIVFDEADFHDGEEGAVNLPDNFRAAITRMLGDAQVWIPSSPWADVGPFHTMFTGAFGNPSADVLSFHSDTRSMNPTLSLADEEAERRRDPVNAAREYDAVPLSANASQFFPEAAIATAVVKGRQSLEPNGTEHWAGVDLGFRKNSSALALARRDGPKTVLAYYDEMVPPSGQPLRPSQVIHRFASTCQSYRARSMQGDMYYADTAQDELAKWREAQRADMTYDEVQPTAEFKARVFTRFRELAAEGKLELPDDPRLVNQMRGVKSRAMPGGVVQIQLPKQGASHGDILFAVVLAVVQAAEEPTPIPPPKPRAGRWGPGRGFG